MSNQLLTTDTEALKSNPELETAFIKLHGREALNRLYSGESETLYTSEQLKKMSQADYEAERSKILDALASGKVQ